jgi:hypothetical protein
MRQAARAFPEVAGAVDRQLARKPPLKTRWQDDILVGSEDGVAESLIHGLLLSDALASASPSFQATTVGQLEEVTRTRSSERGQTTTDLDAGLAIIQAVEPSNEIQAALAAQMVGNHTLAMELLGRARHTASLAEAAEFIRLATKLQRSLAVLVDTQAKLKGGSRQVVEVVHIDRRTYVGPGGQAIVGDVHKRGAIGKPARQAHAPISPPAFGRASLSGEDATGHALPSASSIGEASLPNARREVRRGTQRARQRCLQARPSVEQS